MGGNRAGMAGATTGAGAVGGARLVVGVIRLEADGGDGAEGGPGGAGACIAVRAAAAEGSCKACCLRALTCAGNTQVGLAQNPLIV